MLVKEFNIEGIKSGNKREFQLVFEEYYQMLFHLGMQYLNDEEEAKESVQSAFVKLYESRSMLHPESNIKNFLFTITKNNCLNFIKRKELIHQHHDRIKYLEMHFNYEALFRMGDNYMEFEELKEKIEIAIENLPEHCKRVFLLSRFEDKANKEIAEELNVSLKTVEAHMTKALKLLKTELKDYLPVILSITSLLN